MIACKLTGNTRYRIQIRWFRSPLIVLQVQVHKKGYELTDSYPGSVIDVDEYVWRDAKLEDLKMNVKE